MSHPAAPQLNASLNGQGDGPEAKVIRLFTAPTE